MYKQVLSYFTLLLVASVTSPAIAKSEELPYAMAQCHLSVFKLDRLDRTYNMNGLKFQKVLYDGSEALLMKPKWTGVNSHFTPFIKVFTYQYANADGLDIDVTIESYCNEIPKEHLLRLFKKQRFQYTPGPMFGCYMLDMRDSGSTLARYRYGVMCGSKANVLFIHIAPKQGEEGSDKAGSAKDEKEKVTEDLKLLAEFYMPLLDKYVPEKFSMDLTGISGK